MSVLLDHAVSLYLTVAAGVALVEPFTVGCTGWINCLAVGNDKINYSTYAGYKDDMPALPLYSGRNTSASLRLPIGDANDDYRNQLTVIISNKANYTATIVIYPVKVILLAIYLEQIRTETSYTCYRHVLVTITKSLV